MNELTRPTIFSGQYMIQSKPPEKDFVSVRWSGFLKPLFNDIYTFTLHVNNGIKFWIGDDLLIDEYNTNVQEKEPYIKYSVSKFAALIANRLIEIKLEFRENRGDAMLRLFWESKS